MTIINLSTNLLREEPLGKHQALLAPTAMEVDPPQQITFVEQVLAFTWYPEASRTHAVIASTAQQALPIQGYCNQPSVVSTLPPDTVGTPQLDQASAAGHHEPKRDALVAPNKQSLTPAPMEHLPIPVQRKCFTVHASLTRAASLPAVAKA